MLLVDSDYTLQACCEYNQNHIQMLDPIKKHYRVILHAVAIYFLLLASSLLIALFFSTLTYSSIKKQQLSSASSRSKMAVFPITIARVLTLDQLRLLKVWRLGLDLVPQVDELKAQLEQTLETSNQETIIFQSKITSSLERLSSTYADFYEQFEKCKLAQRLINQNQKDQLKNLRDILPQVSWLLDYLIDHELQILFLLQNSDELRAGGGFVGSMATMNLDQGQLNQPIFYDVYDLANRTEGLTNPPTGVSKYLSSGKNLSLADANWEADFSQSAQNFLKIVSQTELPEINTVIGVSLDSIASILEVTGPITLLDSNQLVYADNLAELARKDRDDFFAGDKRKKMFLNELFTALKIKISQLSSEQQFQLFGKVFSSVQQKNILFYSTDPTLQKFIVNQQAGGTIDYETDFFLYLVESNVGINKANKNILRDVQLNFSPNLVTITIEYFNENQPLTEHQIEIIENNPDLLQAKHMGYINYQRIVTDLPIKQTQILCDAKEKEIEENLTIQTWGGAANQIGFLTITPEMSSARCIINLQPGTELNPSHTWTIVRQPGLPTTKYKIFFFDNLSEFILKRNEKVGGIR